MLLVLKSSSARFCATVGDTVFNEFCHVLYTFECALFHAEVFNEAQMLIDRFEFQPTKTARACSGSLLQTPMTSALVCTLSGPSTHRTKSVSRLGNQATKKKKKLVSWE